MPLTSGGLKVRIVDQSVAFSRADHRFIDFKGFEAVIINRKAHRPSGYFFELLYK